VLQIVLLHLPILDTLAAHEIKLKIEIAEPLLSFRPGRLSYDVKAPMIAGGLISIKLNGFSGADTAGW
jgi:hypothetical protein